MKLWHGGRNLESDYNEPKKATKGRWEYGPGLYLTTHYETAYKYAKGGGKTYQVHFELGTNINDIQIKFDDALSFIQSNVTKSKRTIILEDIHFHLKRMGKTSELEANVFLNLMINHDAVIVEKTINLNKFLVEQGIDYSTVDRFSGRDETVVVIFNHKLIKSVKPIKAKDVSLEEYELPISITNKRIIKP